MKPVNENEKKHRFRFLIGWALLGLIWYSFTLVLRFHIGVLAPLGGMLWLISWLVVFFVIVFDDDSAVTKLQKIGAMAALIPATLFVSSFAGDMVDRVVFEIQRPKYEIAIRLLESGKTAEEACREFRFGCGVSRRNGLRVVFYHPEFYDKYIGYVYDPSGVYGKLEDQADADYEKFHEEYMGELVGGLVSSCRPVSLPYYRCFFS